MFVLLLAPQLLQFAAFYWTKTRMLRLPSWLLDALVPVREFSPPGGASRMFLLHGTPALGALLCLLLYGSLVFLLLHRQLRAIYQGEIYAEGHTARRELKARLGWRLPGLDDVTAAIFEKEMRYIGQSSRLVLQIVYPLVFFMLFAFRGPGGKMFFNSSPEALAASMAGFLLLSLSNMAYNNFGMDKEGFSRWLISPPSLRKVLLVKNLTTGAILVALYLLSEGMIIAIARPHALTLAIVTVGFLAIMFLQFGAGNLVSVYWPKRIELTRMSSKMSSNASGLVFLGVVIAVAAVCGIVAFITWQWQLPWLPLPAALAALIGSYKFYSYLLDVSAHYAFQHIEQITGNLGE